MHIIELKDEIFEAITDTCLEIYNQGELIPIDEVQKKLMDVPGVPIHYPYHHYIQPAAFLTLTAIADEESEETLVEWLSKAEQRGRSVPGGFCGNCGACGGGVGIGIFLSVYTDAAPVKRNNWAMVNEGTGKALTHIATYPGPRCCKRVLFLGAQAGVEYAKEKLDLELPINEFIECHYYQKNPDCLGKECPFYKEA